MQRVRTVVLAALAAFAVTAVAPSSAGAATLLRLEGIGPLRLGMRQAHALATGWLAHRTTGCPLGGPPLPVAARS